MPIKNYTARLGTDQYVSRIMQVLAAKGARSVTVKYEGSTPTGLSFIVLVNSVPVPFLLPCNADGVKKCLQKERVRSDDEHARRVAWAIIKDWVEAQMAIIEAGQASLEQVFLPYAVIRDGITAFDMFLEEASRQKQLTQ